jgi:hypothetical protein
MARESTIGSTFKLEIPPTGSTSPITAATKSAKAVITGTHSLKIGDFVVIDGTGMGALDRMTAHRVSAVTGTTGFTVDTDTTDEAAAATAGNFRELSLVDVCFAEFGNEPSTPGEIDVTTMCDLERRNVAGLSSPGTASFGGPLDMTDAGQLAIIEAQKDGLTRNLIWITRGGQTGMMAGTVSSFAAGPSGVEQAVTFTGNFQIKEAPVYLAPLVTP